ncbi:hypothetical protein DAPPUDRAFT_272385 [Daphnia pulex]|uniref:Uncharacterized protein n=1 Tax=Daphnia pulex TaxID=6669 RepID=E9I2Z4_DAPPU|nr:hypothetical protein DAPPUDRAFT_272385 [Daphnia pulex]|eukprot:EFX61633.1 hypothetical protein DAPPUDRAFT_272385 [Daphnia pulex]
MQAAQAQQAQGQDPDQGQPQEEQKPQPKTLREKYKEQSEGTDEESLNKSMAFYFKDWMKAHDETLD